MFRCNLGEGVEFKTHARVAGAHDAMGNELVLITVMARHAELRPGDRV